MSLTYLHKVRTAPDTPKKHKARDFMFSHLKNLHITGLAGPLINKYCEYVSKTHKGLIEIWERSIVVAFEQMNTIKYPINFKYGDILNAEIKPNTTYDIDLLCTPLMAKEFILKFEYGLFTFCRRQKCGGAIQSFFNIKGETIIKTQHIIETHISYTIHTTNKGKYISTEYCDTSSMFMILKIK